MDWLRVLWTDKIIVSTSEFKNLLLVTRKDSKEFHANCINETFDSARKS